MAYSITQHRKVAHHLTGLIFMMAMIISCPKVVEANTGIITSQSNKLASFDNNRTYSETAYTLGAGDRIRVEILKLPQYSGEYDVLVDGTVNLLQGNSLSVKGLTLEQAAIAIANQYTRDRIIKQPQVTVILLLPRPLKIGIAGEVNRPGSYLMAIEQSRFPSVTRALELAGGITQSADLRQVQVNRTSPSGNERTIYVDLWELVQTGDQSSDIALRDGDTIFIPTANQISLAEASTLATTSFSVGQSQPINVAVLGEVLEPGTHILLPEGPNIFPTVTKALESAGGITTLADIRQVQILRRGKNELEQTIAIDLWRLLEVGDRQQDLLLQNGDTIVVPPVENINLAESAQLREVSFAPEETRPLNITVIGEVFRPGPYTVTGTARTGQAGIPGGASNANNFPTVTRAIQVAGGIKPLADIRNIQIRRFTGVGQQRIIDIDLWKLVQEGDSTQDIRLQQGDSIIVPTATELDPEESQALAAASFSPDFIRVNIVGEVIRPGVVEIPPNTPLNQGIQAAGGFGSRRANTKEVVLIRLNPNGTVTKRDISIDFAKGIDEQNNPLLKNNDVIIVNRNFVTAVTDNLNTLFSPLGSALGVLNFINILDRL